jgi:SET domain-containing protein
MIKVRKSNIHGRGVFATKSILSGTILECDIILLENNKKDLYTYSFPWDKNHYSICMGFASFLNNSENPNLKIKSIDKDKLTKTFITIRDIKADEELLIKYK